MKVFMEEDGRRKEVAVEKRIGGGREWFWFDEKSPNHKNAKEETTTRPPNMKMAPAWMKSSRKRRGGSK